ncbi:hypothetical protein IAU60_000496 [Kwoniella sp. DSM 27419]
MVSAATTAHDSMTANPPTTSTNPSPDPTYASSSTSSTNQARQASQRSRHAQPVPPLEDDQLAPVKSRRDQSHKPKLSRRKKDERSYGVTDEEEWTMTSPPTGANGHGSSAGRGSIDAGRRQPDSAGSIPPPESPLAGMSATGDPAKKEKRSKGRALVKKTSRLFARDKDKADKAIEVEGSHGSSSLSPIPGTRQASYSSTQSSDSQATTSASIRSHNQFFNLHRPSSNHSRSKSPRKGHLRRASQDSDTHSRAGNRSIRYGSASVQEQPSRTSLPLPSRQASGLSASVPSLSRQGLPEPSQPQSGARSPDTLPSRMSTWFSHLLPSTSSTTIPEGSVTSPHSSNSPSQHPPSPVRRPPSAAASFLSAARQRAVDGVRNLLDSEAQPDKCPDTIWVMGVGHPGWRPGTPNGSPALSGLPDLADANALKDQVVDSASSPAKPSSQAKADTGGNLRPAAWARKNKEAPTSPEVEAATSPPAKGFSTLFTASTLSLALPSSMSTASPGKEVTGSDSPSNAKKAQNGKEVARWPEQFYDDFRSRIWCSYRSQYAPILALPSGLLIPSPEPYFSAFVPSIHAQKDRSDRIQTPPAQVTTALPTRPSTSWSWGRTEGLTSDAGWGCMLRTGQSVLANALIHLHLGRDWRAPTSRPSVQPINQMELADLYDYAQYVRILSWFLDDPSPLCPFGVHRMALIGKELGKEVGEWFGPSTAAGALKLLTNSFAPCGLAVATATDSIVYRSDVYAASNLPSDAWDGQEAVPKQRKTSTATIQSTIWGKKAVLILVGIRLGLDGVNPIYFDSVKALFTFPQSVGIAGGRPSSSYYFVGTQANSLFYLDPHLTRPAVPMAVPPANASAINENLRSHSSAEYPPAANGTPGSGGTAAYKLDVVNVDDVSSGDESDGDLSSSPLDQVRTTGRTPKVATNLTEDVSPARPRPPTNSAPPTPVAPDQPDAFSVTAQTAARNPLEPLPVDPAAVWYAEAYPETALKTFHCEKVKKMPLSGLDPSMLLGFLIRDESDWEDFVERAGKLPHKIFSVQDEPPTWDVDSDGGLESVSSSPDPRLDEPGLDDEEIVSVPIERGRHSVAKDDDTQTDFGPRGGYRVKSIEEESPNTTVRAVDIARLGKLDLEDKEDEWVGSGGTPASQKPVMVEKADLESPSPVPARRDSRGSLQASAAPAETGMSFSPNGSGYDERTAHEAEERVVSAGIEHESRQKVRPVSLLTPQMRARTESWVDPGHGGKEAPNGESLL